MSTDSSSHDAQKTLADLRDHLARHDKPIAFLFGAGTSCAIRVSNPEDPDNTIPLIPAVISLTETCKSNAAALGAEYAAAWQQIEKQCEADNQNPNIEVILSKLRMMINAISANDTLAGLNKDQIISLEKCVRESIALAVTPDLNSLSDDHAHRKFARWLSKSSRKNPVEIFTLNYDVLIEHGLEAERVPVFDGFVGSYRPFFNADSVRREESAPGKNWIRLWKMHGSVTWHRVEVDGQARVVRGSPDQAGEMIYPSFEKYDESRQLPYAAFTDRLTRFLEQDDALLIVAGFSFGDAHINNILFGALETRPRTHIYALQFDEPAPEDAFSSRACQRSNLIAICPETGIIGGQRAGWSVSDSPNFIQTAFEVTNPKSESGETAPTSESTGRMAIGDFSTFCNFLEAMATD